jgi:hypothetical protein
MKTVTALALILSIGMIFGLAPPQKVPMQADCQEWSTTVFATVNGKNITPISSPGEPLDEPCCSEIYPELVQLNFYQWVGGEQTLAFSSTGIGPFNNEEDPIQYALDDIISITWFANAWNQPVYRVRVETFTYQPDGSAIVETENHFGNQIIPGYEDCESTDSLTYGVFSAARLIGTGTFETRVTAWECPDAAPITLSIFWNVE